MNTFDLISGCACCQVNRRRFLAAGCAACAGAAGLALDPRPADAGASVGKLRLRIIYSLHADKQRAAGLAATSGSTSIRS